MVGCKIEYVPAEPQHKCVSLTATSSWPAASNNRSTMPVMRCPCCKEQGACHATRNGRVTRFTCVMRLLRNSAMSWVAAPTRAAAASPGSMCAYSFTCTPQPLADDNTAIAPSSNAVDQSRTLPRMRVAPAAVAPRCQSSAPQQPSAGSADTPRESNNRAMCKFTLGVAASCAHPVSNSTRSA